MTFQQSVTQGLVAVYELLNEETRLKEPGKSSDARPQKVLPIVGYFEAPSGWKAAVIDPDTGCAVVAFTLSLMAGKNYRFVGTRWVSWSKIESTRAVPGGGFVSSSLEEQYSHSGVSLMDAIFGRRRGL